MFKNHFGKLLGQLSLELNCTPADLRGSGNTVTAAAEREGRRMYTPVIPLMQMVTVGGGTVISADERLHGFLREFVGNKEGHRLFEHQSMSEIDKELAKYGHRLSNSHHMFLPCRDVTVTEDIPVRWFFDGEIVPFYGDERFPNAICFPKPNPGTPDRITVAAMDGERIMGMAGCSEDAPGWFQIGIDVLPEYRSRGLGTHLVILMKNKIMERGGIPFYGTASSNISSQNIALNAGFKPAWVENESRPIIEPE